MNVLIVGGGMITHDQILPSVVHLHRLGKVGDIAVCATRQSTVDQLHAAFPNAPAEFAAGDYGDFLRAMPRRSAVIVATPDHLHFEMVMTALEAGHHVICVKPLALKREHALRIAERAAELGLFVGVEYHKRFDDRSLLARRKYHEGAFGEFRLGSACLLEKWSYRDSNFQNWFSRENSDAFAYIGCHYVDLVAFITGLRPAAVSVFGIADRFPNGNEGYLWTDARVIWDNGACLNVQNGLGYPNGAPGSNAQGLTMYCTGNGSGALLAHSDQYRGLQYSYADGGYAEPSPDYMQFVEWDGPGLRPTGYGYRSIEALVDACARGGGSSELIATPANSWYNEAVIEAARLSLARGGETVPVNIEQIS